MTKAFHVLVTREASRAEETEATIRARGWTPIVFPTIEFCGPLDDCSLASAVAQISDFDWVVFQSRTAVEIVAKFVAEKNLTAMREWATKFAVVGDVTAASLSALGVNQVVKANKQDAEGLALELVRHGADGKRFLVLRAKGGRDILGKILRNAGAMVKEVVVYDTVKRCVPEREVEALLCGPLPDAALFMSPSAFRAFLDILGIDQAKAFLEKATLCAIGETTARVMSEAGFPPDVVSSRPNLDAALDALAALNIVEVEVRSKR